MAVVTVVTAVPHISSKPIDRHCILPARSHGRIDGMAVVSEVDIREK